MQSLADGLAVIVDSLHGPQVPVRVARHVTPLLDSLVVSLTDLAGELAGAELWDDLPHDFAAAFKATQDTVRRAMLAHPTTTRNFAGEYRARIERMARRL